MSCSKYADMPADFVPCFVAYDFVLENYEGTLIWFGLASETSDGALKRLDKPEPAAEGERLRWVAVLEDEPHAVPGTNYTSRFNTVVLNVHDTSVISAAP